MSVDDEIRRMDAEGFTFVKRDGFYHRKSDGARVIAADWPDGDVTWALDPMPIIPRNGRFAVGTCSRREFERNHAPVDKSNDGDGR